MFLIINFMKMHSLVLEFFHVDDQRDRLDEVF